MLNSKGESGESLDELVADVYEKQARLKNLHDSEKYCLFDQAMRCSKMVPIAEANESVLIAAEAMSLVTNDSPTPAEKQRQAGLVPLFRFLINNENSSVFVRMRAQEMLDAAQIQPSC